MAGLYEEAKETARYEQNFGKGNFSWNCRIMEFPEQRTVNQQLDAYVAGAGDRACGDK